jgi:hypothetical protein
MFQILSQSNTILFQSSTAKTVKQTMDQARIAGVDLSKIDFIGPDLKLVQSVRERMQ